ncbi:hypothetical protein J31TS4_35150 [Paenibacillus sp. J31TS4]|nr:hypothetical protein J31TS4_35150 [Paenibacillus sp. J31TS4]
MPVTLDPGGSSIYQYYLEMSFDPNALELVSNKPPVTDRAGSSFFSFGYDTYMPGKLNVDGGDFGNQRYLKDRQEIFVLHFKIKETASLADANVKVVFGECWDENWFYPIDNLIPGKVSIRNPVSELTVGIGTASSLAGETVEVPVSILTSSAGAGAYGMQLDFDPAALAVQNVRGMSGDYFMWGSDNTEGWLRTVWVDESGGDRAVKAGDQLFVVTFKVKDNASLGAKAITVTNPTDLLNLTFTDTQGAEMAKTVHAGKVTVQPQAPQTLFAVPGNGQVKLRWTPVPGATGYSIYQGLTPDIVGIPNSYAVATLGETETAFVATGLANGTTYYFVVESTSPSGENLFSSLVSARPDPMSVADLQEMLDGITTKVSEWEDSNAKTALLADAGELQTKIDVLSEEEQRVNDLASYTILYQKMTQTGKDLFQLQIRMMQRQLAGLEEGIDSLKGDKSALQSTINTLNEQIGTLQGQVNSLSGDNANLREQIATLTGQISGLQGQIIALIERIADLQQENDTLKQEKAALQEQISSLQEQVADLQTDVNALKGDKRVLQGTIDSLNEQIGSLHDQVNSLSGEKANLAEQIATLTQQISGLQGQIIALIERIASLQQENDTLKREKAALLEQISSLQEQVADLQTDVNALKGDKRVLQGTIDSLNEQIGSLHDQVNNLTGENANLAEQIATLTRQISGLQGQIIALTETIADLQEENDTLKQEKAALQEQISSLQEQVADLQTDVNALKGDKRALQGTIDSLNEQIGTLHDEVNNLTGENIDLAGQISSLNRQISGLQGELVQANQFMQALLGILIGYAAGEDAGHVSKDLVLSQSGAHGATIEWQSSNEAYIGIHGSTGTVKRPSYTEGDVLVTLSSTVKLGSLEGTVTHLIRVVKDNPNDREAAALAKKNLDIRYSVGDTIHSVTQDVYLDVTGDHGTTISWTSSAPEIVDETGHVTRPSYLEENALVTLTARIQRGDAVETKSFVVQVLKRVQTAQEAVDAAKQALEVGYAPGETQDAVKSPVQLAAAGPDGTTIRWASSHPELISSQGTVNRPSASQGSQAVTLTATIEKDGVTAAKTFQVTVRAYDAGKPVQLLTEGEGLGIRRDASGIQVTVKAERRDTAQQPEKAVVVFQLLKGTEAVSILAFEKEALSSEKVTAGFFRLNGTDDTYRVQVFVYDELSADRTKVQTSLADPKELR